MSVITILNSLLHFIPLKFAQFILNSFQVIVMEHYHQWGFLALAQGPIYGPLFQELLLLLQPLSLVPFDLHLPPEPNLQRMEMQKHSTPLPHRLLAQSAQFLQMSSIQTNSRSSASHSDVSKRVIDGFGINQTPNSKSGTQKKEDEGTEMENTEMPPSSTSSLEDKHFSELRWARLFGSGVRTPVGPQKVQKSISGSLRSRSVAVIPQNKFTLLTSVVFISEHLSSSRRPSEWLKLGASKVDLLAQSVWTRKWPEAHLSGNHDRKQQIKMKY